MNMSTLASVPVTKERSWSWEEGNVVPRAPLSMSQHTGSELNVTPDAKHHSRACSMSRVCCPLQKATQQNKITGKHLVTAHRGSS